MNGWRPAVTAGHQIVPRGPGSLVSPASPLGRRCQPHLWHSKSKVAEIGTDNTGQDKPTLSNSTTRGLLTGNKTEFVSAKRGYHEYPISVIV